MIRIATIEQTRAIEAAADAAGTSYQQMMENAGRAAADRALELLAGIESPRVTVLVGAGNNGGDGLVTGLLIAQDNQEAEVRFYLLQERDDQYIEVAREAGLFLALSQDDADKRVLRNMVASADLVIDALFGIGVRLPIRDEAQKILRNTNRALRERRSAVPEQVTINPARTGQIPRPAPVRVLALDCPSGLNCDTGELDNNAIFADETITFITAKPGQFHFPGANAVGTLSIANLGISENLSELKDISDHVVDAELVREKLPERHVDSHKGTFGSTLVVGGSVNFVGAPGLSAQAAYRTGTGLVTVAGANVVLMALASQLREVTWLLLPSDMGVVAEGAVDVLRKELHQYDALLIGPGMGIEETTSKFLFNLLEQSEEPKTKSRKRSLGFQIAEDTHAEDEAEAENHSLPPLVVDADGLTLLAEKDAWWKFLPAETILTPHPGEMARLAGIEVGEAQSNRWQLAREKAAAWNVVLVFKGAHTVITAPDGRLAVLPFKNDALATAGTGDVLAGLITGLRAQGMSAYDAAICGAYLHGLAGEYATEAGNARAVIAGDLIDSLAAVLRDLTE